MPIWKLKPLDPNDVNWGSSKHYGPVVARASGEQAARSLASEAFFEFPQYFGGDIPIDPWTHDTCSSCAQLENSGYTEEGPDELLAPLGREAEPLETS